MDEETYQTLVRDIEKYHDKYKLKEGKFIKIKSNKELKILKRNEIEPILSLAYEHPLSGYFRLEAILIKLKEPLYQWGIDIVGPLTEISRENKYIVVAIDYFTKYPEARALTNTNTKSVANFIYEDIICRHGCSRKIILDRGTYFNNQVIEKLLE